MNIGHICMKIAGRDAGKVCVIVDNIDKTHVLVDGQTRRRKCNLLHLEPLGKTVDIKKGASHAEVAKALSAAGFETQERKEKAPKAEKPAQPKAEKKPAVKKAAKKTE